MIKRIFSVILCLCLLFCLTACGQSEGGQKELNQQDSVVLWDPDEGKNNNTYVPPETTDKEGNGEQNNNTSEPQVIEGRQEFWENYFANNTPKFNYKSFSMNSMDVMDMEVLYDGSVAYMSLSGKVSGQNVLLGLLAIDEDTIYYLKQTDTENTWYRCTEIEESNMTINTDDYGDMDSYFEKFDKMEKLEYVKSIGDIDLIKIYYPDKLAQIESSGDSEYVTTFSAKIKFEYNGVEEVHTYNQQTNVKTGSVSWTSSSSNADSDFSMLDWDIDIENLTLTNGETVIPFEIIENYLPEDETSESDNKDKEQKLSVMEIKISYKTKELQEMFMEEAGVTSTVKGIKCDDVLARLGNPKPTKTIPMEEASSELFSAMFMLMLGGGLS